MKRFSLVLVILCMVTVQSFAGDTVNLNTATQAQLESLNGVGPKKAQAIIEYRTKSGKFKTVDELDNVPGFGAKTVAKLRPSITVGGEVSAKQVGPSTIPDVTDKPPIATIEWEKP